MPAPDGAFRAEQRLGPYELLREIGRGGFASVWLARRAGPGGFESRVAIKLIRIEMRTDPSFQKMLIDEAKLVAGINHPNVVGIFELGEVDDVLYLVMEYVTGRSLSTLSNMMQRAGKPLPVGIVMRILADTCAGLHAAHELERDGKPLGVIHRDVSPQNILVSDKGAVKLIDFGVAKANDRLAADTTDGHTKGKLRYMAPEQALARPVDRRADLWSVGAVAFDLLEGHPPHDGHNDLARLFKLMETSPPPSFATKIPAPLAHVIQKALERDPDARWKTASEMRSAIETALDECGLRVTADDVTAFFGDALTSAEDERDRDSRSDGAILRDRLQRRSPEAATATIDLPIAGGSESSKHREASSDDAVETLSALNTSPHGVPRRPSRIVVALAAAVLSLAVVAFVLGSRHDAPVVAAPEQGTTGSPPETREPRAVPEPAPSPPTAASGPPASVDTSVVTAQLPSALASSSVAPQARPPSRPKTARPRTGRPAPPSASPSSRPRYDDTIQ